MGSISFINRGGSGGSIKPNIFVQDAEPETKEGIWMKSNKKVDGITIADSLIPPASTWKTQANLTNGMYGGASAVHNTDIFLFGSNTAYTSCYKYDTITKTPTYLENNKNFAGATAVSLGDYIYIFGGTDNMKAAYKYDPATNTYTSIANVPVSVGIGNKAVTDGTYIYLAIDLSIYKYDTVANTYSLLTNSLPDVARGPVALLDNCIYVWRSSVAFKYNLDTNESTTLAAPIADVDQGASAITCGSDMYLIGLGTTRKAWYKYNKDTDTYSALPDMPFGVSTGYVQSVGNDIYIIGGTQNEKGVAYYSIPTLDFKNNNIIIVNGNGNYKTQIYENKDINGRLLYGFEDVVYNTTEGGIDSTLPVYYGTGTEWVKFKN